MKFHHYNIVNLNLQLTVVQHNMMQKLYFPILMSLVMSVMMSFVLTAYNTGFDAQLYIRWLNSWKIAFMVALPTALFITPFVHKATKFLIRVFHG